MDPQLRKLLEVSWEAWIDSGLDVWALRHSRRVGVYCGSCGSEVPPPSPPLSLFHGCQEAWRLQGPVKYDRL